MLTPGEQNVFLKRKLSKHIAETRYVGGYGYIECCWKLIWLAHPKNVEKILRIVV